MKSRVKVLLRAEQEVEIEVEHKSDEDPVDLTPEDRATAVAMAEWTDDWEVEGAEVLP